MIPETNRLLLVLRQWEDEEGLSLSVVDTDGEKKIKSSRKLTDFEREFIIEFKPQLLEIIPTMTGQARVEGQQELRVWWKERKAQWSRK